VARAILGEGKTISAPGRAHERAHAIERLFREDLAAFCAYNLRDAELVTRLLERAGLVKLAVKRSLLTGMPLPRVSASIASLDALYLPELHARGHVAPSVRAAREEAEPTEGGAVLAPVAGLHERVLVFDFKSLYPSIMRTFNVDPFTHVRAPAPGQDVIRTPSGACFSREGGILPSLLGRLMAVREDARRRGDAAASQATKVLMSSFYGVLATPACRFHESALANAITQAGQALLRWTKARAEALGHRVLYGDTDSLFVESGAAADEEAQAVGRALVRRLNDDLRAHLAKEHGVDSRLELELEGLHVKLFLPRVRGGAEGARKRYAGLFDDGTRREVVFVGMESARRDATAAAKLLQRGLYERLFAGRPVEAFARDFVRAVRAGEHDEALVYRKALRKDAAGYTATTPPHVRAARLEGRRGRGLVEYVMTVAGPEPLGAVEHAIDHEHYVEKQLRPVVEPLLDLLCLDWDDLVGRPRQLELF
jgi:DNA polymerase-2